MESNVQLDVVTAIIETRSEFVDHFAQVTTHGVPEVDDDDVIRSLAFSFRCFFFGFRLFFSFWLLFSFCFLHNGVGVGIGRIVCVVPPTGDQRQGKDQHQY